MIGALSSIEDHLGFLWGHKSDEALSEEQEKMRQLYEELRSEILDKGNTQMRNIDTELTQYDVTWNRYQYQIPVNIVLSKFSIYVTHLRITFVQYFRS